MRILQLVIFLSFLMFLIIPAPAQADPLSSALSGAVASGIDAFFGAAGNAIMGGNSTSGFTNFSKFYDPLTNPVVVESIKKTSIFGFTIYFAYVLLAMSYLVVQTTKPGAIRTAEYIINKGEPYNLTAFVKKCSLIIALYLFILIIMYIILQMAQVFTDMMGTSSISAIQTTAQSGFMTFIYSIFWLLITILLTLRNLIITFIYCFVVILIMLWGFSIFAKLVETIGLYFLVLAFMQPVMVGIAAIGFQTIQFMGNVGQVIVSIALMIILVVVGAVFIVGPIYFHKQFFSMR